MRRAPAPVAARFLPPSTELLPSRMPVRQPWILGDAGLNPDMLFSVGCSLSLTRQLPSRALPMRTAPAHRPGEALRARSSHVAHGFDLARSEERRVGKECRS